jgi:cytochrome P450
MAPVASPPPLRATNPLLAIFKDLQAERAAEVPFPPGDTDFSMGRTRRFTGEPLPLLLDAYERYGPVFTLRLFHGNVVFMLGPAANHHITVSHATNFQWREGHFRDLISLLGDGLLTTDGAYHRRSRTVMLPAFHRERIAASIGVMRQETEAALARVTPGETIDLYAWTRALALRIAMRALFGLDPDGAQARAVDAAGLFEQALGFYATAAPLRVLRGPGTPWHRQAQATRALNRVLYAEIARRRATGERGEDVLSLLLDAHDEQGEGLTDGQIRDEVMTLLFAGHDTTTTTFTFLVHELGRNPRAREEVEQELDRVLGPRNPTAAQLDGQALPALERSLKETLRCYPAAWVGPRRTTRDVTLGGVPLPGEIGVHYSSWATHHLPQLYPDPFRFEPDRFLPEREAALPRGAYIPFGGGSRMCIGKRFGEYELRALASILFSRVRLEPLSTRDPQVVTTPTLGPKGGLHFVVRPR